MRILDFTIHKQRLTRTSTCDFSGLVAGSAGYLQAKFNFSSEWAECKKAASFIIKNANGDVEREYGRLLDENNTCDIPPEVLTYSEFYVRVKGIKEDVLYRIETSEIRVTQEVYY